MMKVKHIIAYMLFTLMLVGCINQENETTVDIDTNFHQESIANKNNDIFEFEDYYSIIQTDSLYYVRFYDDYGNLIKEEGPLAKSPVVIEASEKLIRFTYQAGTGISTRWGYYYDTENLIFSDIFEGIFDECDDKVACVGLNKVIVSDIFDSSKYYKEFSEFSYSFSQVATPITNIEFSEGGQSIIVSYLAGEDYQEVTETFEL